MKQLRTFTILALFGTGVFWTMPTLAKEIIHLQPGTYVEGEVLVQYANPTSLNETTSYHKQLQSVQARSVEQLPNLDYRLVQSRSLTTKQLLNAFGSFDGVMHVQPNYLYTIARLPDPDRSLEYRTTDAENSGTQVTPWGVGTNGVRADDEAQDNGVTGAGTIVAVIDTGVDYAHEDLDGNIWDAPGGTCTVLGVSQPCLNHGWDFINSDNNPIDDHGHGTHVAGTVAAEDNTVGVIGVAPNAEIMAIKVLNASGVGSTTGIASGVDFARVNGADVINMSIGASSYDGVMETAVTNAWDAGVVVISAAGNEAIEEISYPAGFEDSISVGAIQETATQNNPDENMNTRLAYFSNYGTVDVVAPGRRVNSTLCTCNAFTGGYSGDSWNGTSMASPHVAGVAALILQAHPTFSPAQVKQVLESTATDLGITGRDHLYGSGLVNAATASTTLGNQVVLTANHEISNGSSAPDIHLPVLPADGTTSVQLIARVTNSSGTFVSGETVTFTSTAGTFSAVSADTYVTTTDVNGIARATFTAPDTSGTVTVTATTDNYGSASIPIEITDVLVVTDHAEWYLQNTLSWWLRTALEDQNSSFVRFDTMRLHPDRIQTPTADYLGKFSTVIWATDELTLPDASQTVLADYLDNGGNLFLSGQDFLYNAEEGNHSDILFTDYLKIAPLASDGIAISYTGDNGGQDITGADILNDITIDLVELSVTGQGPSYTAGLLPDWGTLQSGATSLGSYDTVSENAGAKVDSTYRSIFLPYAFASVELRNSRKLMMGEILNFLKAFADVTNANIIAGADNNENEITTGNVTDVRVTVTFATIPTSGYAGVTLSDGETDVTGSVAVDGISDTVVVSGIDASTLNDGEISVFATHTNTPTNFLQTFPGTAAVKSTTSAGNLSVSQLRKSSMTVYWNPAIGTVDHYDLSYGTDENATTSGITETTNTNLIVSSLIPNTRYYFKVRSNDGINDSVYSAKMNVATLASKATQLKAKKRTTKSITLRWQGDGTSYQIRYGTNKKAKNRGKLTTTKKRRIIKKLKPNKSYYFKVKSYNVDNVPNKFSKVKKITTQSAQIK